MHHWPAALVYTIRRISGDEFRRGRATGSRRYVLLRARGSHGSMSFSFTITKDWNALPEKIRAIKTLSAFKRTLLGYLRSELCASFEGGGPLTSDANLHNDTFVKFLKFREGFSSCVSILPWNYWVFSEFIYWSLTIIFIEFYHFNFYSLH